MLKWHFWQSAIFQHDLLDPLTPVLLTSSAFIKTYRSRGQSSVCWWTQMSWIFSTHASDFSPPAAPRSKYQSSFPWRCSGWFTGFCDSKATEEKEWLKESWSSRTFSCGCDLLLGIAGSWQACADRALEGSMAVSFPSPRSHWTAPS